MPVRIGNTRRFNRAWPDETNTGPSGDLTTYSGNGEFRTSNVTIANMLVNVTQDTILVKGTNITFSNCRFVYVDEPDLTFTVINIDQTSDGIRFLDCEVDGQDGSPRGIFGSGTNLRVERCHIHHTGNGIEVSNDGPSTILDSYLHDIHTPDGFDWHADGIQCPGGSSNILVRHNTILLTGPETGCFNCYDNSGSLHPHDIVVENNLMGGGSYSVYLGGGATGVNLVVRDNQFTTRYYSTVGDFGIYDDLTSLTVSGNVIHETGVSADDNDGLS